MMYLSVICSYYLIASSNSNACAFRVNGVSDGFEPILAALDVAIIP